MADQRDAVTGEAPLHGRPDAPQQRNRFVTEECLRFTAAEDRETPRLVEVGSDLCEEFVLAQSNRHRDAERSFDADGEPDEELGGTLAVQRLCAAEVEKRLVDRDKGSTSGVSRLISARTARPTWRYLSMFGRITTASGQAASALNIAMAERTPYNRAT